MQQIILRGKIAAGHGEGKKFLDLLWVKKQIQEKLHFTPYPGTLNLILTNESVPFRALLKKTQYARIEPAEGFYDGIAIPALINSQKCAIIVPKIKNYPKNMIEIIAPLNLRQILKIKDGDEVSVYFYV